MTVQIQLDEYWSCRCGMHTYSPLFVYAILDVIEKLIPVEESWCANCETGPTVYFKRTRYREVTDGQV